MKVIRGLVALCCIHTLFH